VVEVLQQLLAVSNCWRATPYNHHLFKQNQATTLRNANAVAGGQGQPLVAVVSEPK
jgi:hypothetical protein